MDHTLAEYITKSKNNDREAHYTHVSCIRPKCRLDFSRDALEGLWQLYCARLIANPDLISGLAEIPQEYSMLVVDGDIKKPITDVLKEHPEIKTFVKDGEETKVKYTAIRLYTLEHIQKTIKVYQDAIRSVTKNWQEYHSVCILLEKDPYIQGDNMKSGFHLAFINYFCEKASQDAYLIPRVIEGMNKQEVFKDLGYPVSAEVLDISKHDKPWLLYGSRKSETSGQYRVSKAFDHDGEVMDLSSAFDGYTIYDTHEREIEFENDVSFYYPRIFSINPCHRKCIEIIPLFNPSAEYSFSQDKKERPADDKYDQTMEQKLKTARELVEMLDVSRAEKRDDWMEIGWILFSISDGNEEGLQIWVTFSQQASDKFTLEVCLREWSRMYKGTHTLGSLHYYAKIDSPEEYEEFCRIRKDETVKKAITGSHHDLAKALHESYRTEYVCASLKPEMWFFYTNHHWEPMEEGIDLRQKISEDLVRTFTSMIQEQFTNLAETEDEDTEKKKTSETKITAIYKLIKNLKSNPFKNSIMKECREVFYDRKFLRRLGKNKNLIALQNGVYDLKNHIFREGKPEDYIALQMPISYRVCDNLDPWMIEVNNFFDKVYPDTAVREYALDRLAELLPGGNKRKHVYIWTGRGNNAKSVLKLIIQKMFGDHCIDIPNSILTGPKPKAGAACPELARADRGVRVAFTQEPNAHEKFNTGAVKEYSGNDSFYTRTIFEKGGEVEPMFKLIIIANDLPGVTTNDPAFWNRIRVIPNESTFVDNPPESEEEQYQKKTFLKDENFEDKVPNMLEPLFYLLTSRLKNIKRIISEPDKVKIATEKYRKSQDVFAQFIDERMIMDEKKAVTVNEFYQMFKDWHKSSFTGTRIPDKNETREYLIDCWGHPISDRWFGWRLREEKDDILSGEAEEVKSTSWTDGTDGNPMNKRGGR